VTGRGLEVLEWNQVGYQPLVFSHDWQVALLNWEQIFDLEKLGEVERHNQTDEVFVLLKGRALIFTVDDQGMQTEDMKPGVLYNVHQGVWHNLVSTRDASWVIVENRDTHLNDCDFRKLSPQELTQVKTNLPDWAS
jgi:mannose-6-phosphate isomerase-like protein (cupin superfamily)